jgi:purine-binding chemotaxis protein CheW
MNIATETVRTTACAEIEYVTFYVGDILLGIDITGVDEINQHVEVTPVPHAPQYVCGVLNLRGEVVTVVDLRMILGLPQREIDRTTRTVIVRSKEEQIGLRVDRIADVVKARSDEIDPVPSNFGAVDGRFFKGVYKLETELLLVLNIDAALAGETNSR